MYFTRETCHPDEYSYMFLGNNTGNASSSLFYRLYFLLNTIITSSNLRLGNAGEDDYLVLLG